MPGQRAVTRIAARPVRAAVPPHPRALRACPRRACYHWAFMGRRHASTTRAAPASPTAVMTFLVDTLGAGNDQANTVPNDRRRTPTGVRRAETTGIGGLPPEPGRAVPARCPPVASRNVRRRLAFCGDVSHFAKDTDGTAPVHRHGPCSKAWPLFTSRRFV